MFDGLRKIVRFGRETAAAWLYLRKCSSVGRRCRLAGRPIIENLGRLVVGDRLRLNSQWNPVELSTAPGARIEIGDDVAINYGTLVSATEAIRIGDRVQIGNLSIIDDVDGAPGARQIEIGDDVWLAARVTVLPGTHIGQGSVITAGSIVSGRIPPRVIAGGIPARVLRALDSEDSAASAAAASEVQADSASAASPNRADQQRATARSVAGPVSRGLITADFTVDDLATALRRNGEVPLLDARIAPFNQVVQTLHAIPGADERDFLVVWTRPESAIPSFGRLLDSESVDANEITGEVATFCGVIGAAAAHFKAVFVPTWTVPPRIRGLGLLDGRSGMARALASMNLTLMERFAAGGNVYVLDAQRWLAQSGDAAYQPKPWYMGKLLFQQSVMASAAKDIKAAMGALTGLSRKVVVVDLDDTMWGGTVGETGWMNLRLGGHDAEGEAFVDFQRGLKSLTRRGIVLAIASRNDEAVAMEALRQHPEMVLRPADFVAHRINWGDKAQNIADIARELNLGLQSFVFIDNDAVQRARVREALPEVLVPEWPDEPVTYRSALDALTCFDSPAVTALDASRTAQYATERAREQFRNRVASVEEWLLGLDMKVRVEELSSANLSRVSQLMNKTNQMNLSTRRLTSEELTSWLQHGDRRLWAISVADRFGDAGLTGIISVERDGTTARIVDYVLSCRVMGRKVEETMLSIAVADARERHLSRVEAHYRPTAKNKPCLSFLLTSGFAHDNDEKFVWNTEREYPCPPVIALAQAAEQSA